MRAVANSRIFLFSGGGIFVNVIHFTVNLRILGIQFRNIKYVEVKGRRTFVRAAIHILNHAE